MRQQDEVLALCGAETMIALIRELRGAVHVRVATSARQGVDYLRRAPSPLAVVVERGAWAPGGGEEVLVEAARRHAGAVRVLVVEGPLGVANVRMLGPAELVDCIVVMPWFPGQVIDAVCRRDRRPQRREL
jgi:hypothetical protein